MENSLVWLQVRVLDIEEEECILKIEVSISGSGRFRAIEVVEAWTYYSLHRDDGSIYGEGKGVIMTKNRNEFATATGRSIGKHTMSGKMRYAGTHFYRTNSPRELAFLNNLVAVIEYEVHHESSSYVHKLWEWK